MKIEIFYLDNTYEILDTSTLTKSPLGTADAPSIMTKFHFNFGEFLHPTQPSNLNLYIYYYRANNDKGASITNCKYLDDLLFYDNDQRIHKNPDEELVRKLGKELPYGSMESGCWITLVPLSKKAHLENIIIDGKIVMCRNSKKQLTYQNKTTLK